MDVWERCGEQQQLLGLVRRTFLHHGAESSWPSAGSAAEKRGDPAAGTLLCVGALMWKVSRVCPGRRVET